MADILVLAAHPSLEHSRVNRRLLQRGAPAVGTDAGRGARPVRALPRLPDRRAEPSRRRSRGAARRLAAPDALVRHAAADEAVARRGARLRLGLRPGRHGAARQGPVAGRSPPAGRRLLPRPTATTATSSTPSCRRTSRPRRCAGCASCRRWCCTARTAPADADARRARASVYATQLASYPAGPRLRRELRDDCRRLRRCTARPTAERAGRAPLPHRARARLTGRSGAHLMEHASWLTGSLVYLAAAVLAVPLARLLGLGSIIGYLAAGIAIGPWGLGFVHRPAGHAALRRVRRRADAVPGRARARAAAAVGAAQADLRLGQRAAVRLGGADRRRRRSPLGVPTGALGAGAPALRAGAVVDRDRPGRARRAQPDGHHLGPERAQRRAAAGRRRDSDPGADPAAGARRRGAATPTASRLARRRARRSA